MEKSIEQKHDEINAKIKAFFKSRKQARKDKQKNAGVVNT